MPLCERCHEHPMTTVQEYRDDDNPAHWPNLVTRRCDRCAKDLRDYVAVPRIAMTIVHDTGREGTTCDDCGAPIALGDTCDHAGSQDRGAMPGP